MNINSFKSNFKMGAKPTLYEMEIQGLPEKLKFLCKIAQLPGRTITPIEVPAPGGHTVKIAGDNTFEDITITLQLDTDFAVKNEIEKWMEDIRNSVSSEGKAPADYKKEGFIIQYDEKDNIIAKYQLFGMWPTTADPIELGFDQKDTISEASYTFSIDYWLRSE